MDHPPRPGIRFLLAVEKAWDEMRHAWRGQDGYGKLAIVTYNGIGNRRTLWVRGRVLKAKPLTTPGAGDSLWRNLRANLGAFITREVPEARVLARHGQMETRVQADKEGFFEARLDFPHDLPADLGWIPVELTLEFPVSPEPVVVVTEVSVPLSGAPFGILSDLDDTLIRTGSASLFRMAQATLFGNAHTRLPFPGMAGLVRALQAGPGQETGVAREPARPLYCVSSSPWNLHGMLAHYLRLHGISGKPVLFLRDWGLSEKGFLPSVHRDHKMAAIRRILETTDPLPFVLLGDSAQEDPEIYREAAEAYPGRVLAVYIRIVGRDPKRPEAIRELAKEVVKAGSILILAEDTLAMAEHAWSRGWIGEEEMGAIRAEVSKDAEPGKTGAAGTVAVAVAASGNVSATLDKVDAGGIEKTLREGGNMGPGKGRPQKL